MRYFGKRALSMLCTLAMLLSLMAMIVPGASAAEESLIFKADDITLPMQPTDEWVDDADSQYGRAIKLSAEKREGDGWLYPMLFFPAGSGKTLPIYANNGTDVLLGSLTDVQIQQNAANGQYVAYTFGNLDLSGATFMYTFDWTVRINFTEEQQSWFQGKSVDMVVSMKATGDVTGADTANPPAIYIDYISFVSKTIDPVGGVSEAHALFNADYTVFPEKADQLTSYVDDDDAYGGKAVRHLDDEHGISITRYQGAESKIGTLAPDLLVGKGYQVHKFTYTVPETAAAGGFVFIMSNWQFQSPALSDAFVPYAGQTIEVYISMKVEKASGADYAYYIDRVTLATVCETINGVCDVCGKTDALLAQIPSEHLGNVRDYTYFASAPAEGTDYVDDAEAFGGKAVCFSRSNLDENSALNGMTFVTLHHYYGPDNGIGNLFKADLKINQGYQIYKFTYEVPADATDSGVIYLIPNWQLNSSQLSKDLYAYRGKTVDIYVSMKVAGPAADGYYSVSVDRVALATPCSYNESGVCSECGKRISYTFLANDFTVPYASMGCDKIVTDADSAYGKAAKFSYADRVATGDAGLMNSMLRVSTETLDMKSYLANPETYVDIGSISIGRLNENSGKGYVTYTFRNVVPVPTNDSFFIYLFNCWGFQVKLTEAQIAELAGKNVDISLSMKVEGNVSDPSNPPSYYIDKVTISGHVDETCEHGKTGVGLISDALHGTECYLCGEILSTEEHTFDEGVENGDMITFTCSGCGYTRTAVIQKPATGWNLELDGNISLKFVLNVTAEEAAAATVDVTVNGETTTKNVAGLKVGEQYILIVEVAAAQMSDAITVTLNKNGEAISKDYSVRGYADVILNGDYNEATKNLVKYMLAYGAASQIYFDYNDAEENLADKGIEVNALAVPTEGGMYSVTGSANGVEYYGSSLVYRNMIAARIYFSGDVTGKTFTVNGETVTPEAKGDLYYVEVADICPWDLDDGITVAVDGLTVVYAPMDYIIRMYAKGGASADLVQALYGYYQAAEEYLFS